LSGKVVLELFDIQLSAVKDGCRFCYQDVCCQVVCHQAGAAEASGKF